MRAAGLLLLCLHSVWGQQYEAAPQYEVPSEGPYYYEYEEQSVGQQPIPPIQTGFQVLTQPDHQQPLDQFEFVPQQQQQSQQEIIPVPTLEPDHTEPTEPGPLDCREEQYYCTRLYSMHKPCKQCLQGICLYSMRRVYVVNKEFCTRMVCAHEELLRADACRDQYPLCTFYAMVGRCHSLGSHCGKSCGGC